ncbi:conserved protein, unknown function [Hepatocystis sp. ex Piliocolobus tephrosceles]|nr:conserved protein, unknown function [Hepatocystis sp. ex Piliocolobus tephrosceles]
MDNIVYYIKLPNNTIQPVIVRQPQAIVISNKPNPPITLDIPAQNIIVKNDEPQPIIVRQENPNIIFQQATNDNFNFSNYTTYDPNKINELNNNTLNNNQEYGSFKENIIKLNTPQQTNTVDFSYTFNNENFIDQNRIVPMNIIHNNNHLNAQPNFSYHSMNL